MKGNPLLRLGLMLISLAMIFLLIGRGRIHDQMTKVEKPALPRNTPLAVGTLNPVHAGTLRATLLLHATPPPLHCSIRQQGILLLSEKEMIAPGEYRAAVNIAKGVALVVAAEWPDEEQHSVGVEVLVHGYQATLEKSFWAERTLEDTLSIPDSFLP